MLTGTWANINNAVSRLHHLGVVLHHHQAVTGITQSVQNFDKTLKVARMQTNRGLIQHKKGIHQRGAQRGGEVNALNLTPRKGSRLTIKRKVAQPHLLAKTKPRGHLFKHQLGGGVAGGPRCTYLHAFNMLRHGSSLNVF